MQRNFLILIFAWLCVSVPVLAQAPFFMKPGAGSDPNVPPPVSAIGQSAELVPSNRAAVPLVSGPVLPRMAPELALKVCRGRSVIQAANLASYSATTLIQAKLPDTAQSGEYEVQQNYLAPRTLTFKAVRFTGDPFVKSSVILRLLQSEVDHVQKDEPELNAISPQNYKFSYKGTTQWDGRLLHIYQLKPRKKRAGLFKGRIYVDAYSGSLVRAEGRPAKSPSLFIKKIEFVQDYADIGQFTFPVHVHSEARARIVGRAIVDVYQRNYQPVANPVANGVVASTRVPAPQQTDIRQ